MNTEIDLTPHSCMFVNSFDEQAVLKFKVDLDRLMSLSLPIIPIYIDSYGGDAYSLFAMIDLIESIDVPIATICIGKAMSAGAILLASGSPGLRFCGKNSVIMIHEVASSFAGKVEEMKSEAGETDRVNNYAFELLAKKCGYKNSNHFKKMISTKKHANWYLSANDARKHKIIDHIDVPMLQSFFTLKLLPEKNKKKSVKVKSVKKTKVVKKIKKGKK